MIKKEAENIYKTYNRNTVDVECKNKNDISHNGGYHNHLMIIQNIPEQRTGKVRNQVITANSHVGYCTHAAESTNVKVQKV